MQLSDLNWLPYLSGQHWNFAAIPGTDYWIWHSRKDFDHYIISVPHDVVDNKLLTQRIIDKYTWHTYDPATTMAILCHVQQNPNIGP